MLHTMYYADEVRGLGELNLPEETVQIGTQEKTMAKLLVEHLTGEFKPEGFKDGYREAALNLIEAKLNSTTPVEIPAAPAQGRVGDLMEALRASIEAAKKSTAGKAGEPAAAEKAERRARTPAAAAKTPVTVAEKKPRAKKAAVTARK
jgi:DNA end-binding protein Ku